MSPSPLEPLRHAHLRIARSTNHLAETVAFYRDLLGFHELGRFDDHDGFDGVMLGHPDAPYHLEFTRHRAQPDRAAADPDDLLVFYVPDRPQWEHVVGYIEASGVESVRAANPYWDRFGRTYEDPDGARVVICHQAWRPD